MPKSKTSAVLRPARRVCLAVAVLCGCAPACGCINAGVMFGKVLFGDPQVKSEFEQRTGVSLLKNKSKVAVVCTTAASLNSALGSLEYDLQEEVTRRMRMHQLDVASDGEVISALNRSGGKFNQDTVAAALDDVDYIIHVEIAQFTHTEDGNPKLYRGRSDGIVYAYEVNRGPDAVGSPRALKVFYQEFKTEYPKSRPVPAEEMAERVFQQRCVDQLADLVGRKFYDVKTSELFN